MLASKAGKILQVVYAYILAFFMSSFFKTGEEINYTYSIFPILLFIAVLYSFRTVWKSFGVLKLTEKAVYGVFVFAFFACMSVGKMADTMGYLELTDIKAVLAPFIVTPYFVGVVAYIYEWMDNGLGKHNDVSRDGISTISKKEYAVYFIFMFVCWLIVLLGVYPGFFVYDATDELMEVITRSFTTHHPLAHVLYLGGIVQAGYKIFGSYNIGIFVFFLVQMLVFSIGIVYAVRKMSEFGFIKIICRITVIFMALFPVSNLIVLCSCKDSLFALFMLLWVVEAYDMVFMDNIRAVGYLCVCSVILCLLRNNAVYALIAAQIIMIIILKHNRRRNAIMFVGNIVSVMVLSAFLAAMLNASTAEQQEMLTVPIQQIARVYNLEPDCYTDEDRGKLYEYIPEEYLNKYSFKLSDMVKYGFVNEKYKEDKAEFWKLWLKGLKKSPVSYLNAWLMTGYGYWYPDTVIDVYTGNTVYTFTYDENSFFGYETEYPGIRQSFIPVIDNFYRKISLNIYKEKIPVVSMLFSMGFMFWIYVFIVGYIVRKKGIKGILPYIMIFMTWCTLLLGPTYLPRYVFFLWMSIMFAVGDVCSSIKEE